MKVFAPAYVQTGARMPNGRLFIAPVSGVTRICLSVDASQNAAEPDPHWAVLSPTLPNDQSAIIPASAFRRASGCVLSDTVSIEVDEQDAVFENPHRCVGSVLKAQDQNWLIINTGDGDRAFVNLETGYLTYAIPEGPSVAFPKWSIVKNENGFRAVLATFPTAA